ncbi:hypothetical protein KAI56_00890 [Candidatus Parcubacteria bacterium]|nr:hypothetical protein [Candidatus Parcubacteria bacterium]
MERSEELGIIHGAIEKLCNDEDITKEELKLVKEELEIYDGFVKHLDEWNEYQKVFGIDLRKLSGDGFARDDVLALGPKKWLNLRSEKIMSWREALVIIENKIKKIENRS